MIKVNSLRSSCEYLDPAVPSARASATVIATSGRTEVDIEGRRFLVLNNGQRYEENLAILVADHRIRGIRSVG